MKYWWSVGCDHCYTRYIKGSYFIYKSVYIEKKSYIIDIIIDINLLIYNIWLFLYIEELDFAPDYKTNDPNKNPPAFLSYPRWSISLIGLVGVVVDEVAKA